MKKNTRSADFCADQIDIITNFAVITNVVIKRVHCMNIGYKPIHQFPLSVKTVLIFCGRRECPRSSACFKDYVRKNGYLPKLSADSTSCRYSCLRRRELYFRDWPSNMC